MTPAIGARVQYALTAQDAALIKQRRSLSLDTGSTVNEGVVCAAIVTAAFADGSVNMQVFLDGTDTHWVERAKECIPTADAWMHPLPGTWDWPDRCRFTFSGDIGDVT